MRAREILWVVTAGACLTMVLWLVPAYLFDSDFEGKSSVRPAGNSTGPPVEQIAASNSIAGLWGKVHRDTGTAPQTASVASRIAFEKAKGNLLPRADEPSENARPGPAELSPSPAAPILGGIEVSFKTVPAEGGRRGKPAWAQLSTFSRVQAGNRFIVEAKARGASSTGAVVDIDPEWIPADPDMISVSRSPTDHHAVAITVLRAGQSSLTVSLQGVSRELSISASYEDKGMRVKITQE